MVDSTPAGTPPPQPRPQRLWLLIVAAPLLLVGAGFAAWWGGAFRRPLPTPLEGELQIAVRPPGANQETFNVADAGALPVRAGGRLSMQARLTQPAYVYLVWLTAAGEVVPLYPWNNDAPEVKDLSQPPVRKPATVVSSPMTLGSGWQFGKRGGLETVLLLARRTPLGKDANLGELLRPLPAAPLRQRDELAVLAVRPQADSVSTLLAKNRGTDADAQAADEPLLATLLRLRPHFELIRAVRFAHEGE